ncbi:MAG: hypothetical protein H7A46_08625 [Verrucomicrobiales bacterium]|nr:hypothetical protein [Verrucomicrobiales bacterium]
MDQNGNGVPGDPDDAFEARFLVDTHGPAVVAAVVMRNGGLVGWSSMRRLMPRASLIRRTTPSPAPRLMP